MTIVLFVVVLAVVIGAGWALSRRDGADSHRARHTDPWTRRAQAVIDQGWDVAAELDIVVVGSRQAAPGDAPLRLIDDFIGGLAAVTADAPTTADARVCRVTATKSWTLRNALQSLGGGSSCATIDPMSLDRSYTEFRLALGDLGDHVKAA